jgi:UDP-N-acetylmuramoyl-L-alanyl-D-glutamate--2,6-diaminopimelate ligase
LDLEVQGISHDSRFVRPGEVYVCLKGLRTDGHRYAQQAVGKGAVAVVSQEPLNLSVPVICVDDTRHALSFLADRYFARPSSKLNIVGVTGTNGKTTTTHFLQAAYRAAGRPCAVIGTVGIKIDGEYDTATLTTPEAFELHRTLYEMKNRHVADVAMEVSSHSLVWKRVEHVNFSTAVFTNLSHDHLDFHGTMEEYFLAKAHLFNLVATEKDRPRAIINADDPYGRRLLSMVKAPVLSFGLGEDADVRGVIVKEGASSVLSIHYGGHEFEVVLRLPGRFNVYNVLAAAAAALSDGVDRQAIAEGIGNLLLVPGRMETVNFQQEYNIIIDFAHTPDGLEKVLLTLGNVPHRRLITVFGCPGDRDRTKRPLMGRIAETYSDVVIVSSDNPGSEDPEVIIHEIVAGMETNPIVLPDREEAVRYALSIATKGDIVLLAGKGHETYQLVGDKQVPYSDKQAVETYFIS